MSQLIEAFKAIRKWYRSWTINFGVLLSVAGVIQLNLAMVQEQLGKHYGWVTIAIGVVVVLLRAKTNKGLNER